MRISLKTPLERFEDKILKTDSCWLWQAYLDEKGYGRFRHETWKRAHRVSYEFYKGEIPKGLCVCHECDIRNCVNPDHLWLGTNQENVADRDKKGRHKIVSSPGERNGQARLTEKDIKEIRNSKLKRKELASIYGIDYRHVWQIQTRRRWKHVD